MTVKMAEAEAVEVDHIREMVATNAVWAERAIVALYSRQTADEQVEHLTKHSNGMGFNGTDAEILSSFAQQIERKGTYGQAWGSRLSPRQLEIAHKRLGKYSRQLHQIQQEADERRAAVVAAQSAIYQEVA